MIFFSCGPANVNGAYSCLHQRNNSLCIFLPRGWGGRQWDLCHCVWTGKRTISYSVSTVAGKKLSPLPAWLKESVRLSKICLRGRVQAFLSCNAMDFSRGRTVGARAGLDPAASWLLRSDTWKSPRGLSLVERSEIPALTGRDQHSTTWTFVEVFAIWLQTWVWRDQDGKECILDWFLGKRACLVPKRLTQSPSADFRFITIE